jgi:hypothetical protein
MSWHISGGNETAFLKGRRIFIIYIREQIILEVIKLMNEDETAENSWGGGVADETAYRTLIESPDFKGLVRI